MNKLDFDLITSLSMHEFPFFEGFPWGYSHDNVNEFIQFCQSVGVLDVYISFENFPLFLHVNA
jgi:hypothetical protein